MITLSVCLETVFPDLPVPERIARIARAGYSSIEFWHPEGSWDGSTVNMQMPKDATALRQACDEHDVVLKDFALHSWDGSIGGCPVRSGDRETYLTQIRKMIDFAQAAGCGQGITLSGTVDPDLSRTQMRDNLEAALGEAAQIARQADFTLLLEPLNTLVDHPGYYLDSSAEAVSIVQAVNSPHLKILYDVYHMQIMEGNVLATIEENLEYIGHFHSAGVPGRTELFGGELDYPTILRRIEQAGYQGAFGLEYFPAISDHMESLTRIRDHLQET